MPSRPAAATKLPLSTTLANAVNAWKRSMVNYCINRNNISLSSYFILFFASCMIAPSRRFGVCKEMAMEDSRRIDLAALLLRIALGAMFVAHALLKYLVFTPAGTARFFESLGLPGPLAYLTIGAELAGGVLLIVGAYTRIVAFALIPILLGAAWAHS